MPEPVSIVARLGERHLALVGLMAAGKSAIGRRVAEALSLPFVDSDAVIEEEQGMAIRSIFDHRGETSFRAMEETALRTILARPASVIATGGGAFLQPGVRDALRGRAVSLWLRAELPVLLGRIHNRQSRPLLAGKDPEAVLSRLMEVRYPVYAEADVIVESTDVSRQTMVTRTLAALDHYLVGEPGKGCAS